ncbi:MAG: SDR family NAD(P)-dependent oxidoreductase, partial [Desulfobacterota bacterium]|nr:SDR family NAD(P)-dependent oxidoreductase [Thermodesulfobacteriota bacterium]
MVFLAGMNAIVTGASRGIGKAIAETLAAFHINLCLAARNPDQLNDTTVEIIKKYGVKVIPVTTDVAKLSDLENLVKIAKQKLGNIDI